MIIIKVLFFTSSSLSLFLLLLILSLLLLLSLELPDQICTSPYCEPYNSYDASYENVVLID